MGGTVPKLPASIPKAAWLPRPNTPGIVPAAILDAAKRPFFVPHAPPRHPMPPSHRGRGTCWGRRIEHDGRHRSASIETAVMLDPLTPPSTTHGHGGTAASGSV